ncbi:MULTISPECIES: hydrogenase maturation protease [Acidianus]|uniref:Hydrogenase maturation protease n=1 Tax=Candidatus Acidianus copahuensis TaxID=1160895 RepID=A0A031LK40_9CREN|nr:MULTISPECIES: hydrogenase maturation protease [Acidianus]EZQ01604.1 hydrogenase maturation protease [Candidatus Acidianus copahuensis]NON61570.1 hydrogenase maturation protease [Acidianus sp. RZ1]
MAVKVIGIGNRLYGDDAIGSLVAECLNFYDAEANGFQALSFIKKEDIIFFIDAMLMDEDYGLFKIDVNKEYEVDISDPHRLSPVQVIFLAKRSGELPSEAYILAIKPERVDWPGLSERVIQRAEGLFTKYREFLSKYGIEVNPKQLKSCLKSKEKITWT